jgi:hypothetical protein
MAKSCEHLEELTPEDFPAQRTPGACEECLAQGTVWVALRESPAVKNPRPAERFKRSYETKDLPWRWL